MGFLAYEDVDYPVWVDSFGYDVMVNDSSLDRIVA